MKCPLFGGSGRKPSIRPSNFWTKQNTEQDIIDDFKAGRISYLWFMHCMNDIQNRRAIVEETLNNSTKPKVNMETEYEYEVRFTRVGDREASSRLFTSENEAVAFRDGLDITGAHGKSIVQIPKPWTPKVGDKVYVMGYVTRNAVWLESYRDDMVNYFRTRAEAEAALAVCVEALKKHKESKQVEQVKAKRWTARMDTVGNTHIESTDGNQISHNYHRSCKANPVSDDMRLAAAQSYADKLNIIAP